MEYYSALAKRRRLEKQDLSVVAAPSSLLSQTRKSSRLLADDAKIKCDEPSSINTSSRRGKKRVSISDKVEVRTISPRKSPHLSSAAAKSNASSETEIDDNNSDDYDSDDEDEELGDYIYRNSRTAQHFREERKLASAPSAALRKSPRLSSVAVKSDDTEVIKQKTTKYQIGTRMAKEFFIEDRKVTELCYGSVTRYNSSDNSYSVLYDDGDKEDISEVEIAILVNNATRISTKTFTNTKKRTTKPNRNPIVASSSDAVTIATRRVVCRNGRFRTICSTAGCINLAVN